MNEANKDQVIAKPHSGLGIASVIISIATIFLAVCWCLLSYLFFEQIFGSSKFYSVSRFVISSFVLTVFGLLLHILGGIFGIIGWRSIKTNDRYPMLGTVVNFMLIFADILLIVLLIFISLLGVLASVPVH